MAESAKNSVKKGILGAAVFFGAVLLILAALIGIRMFRLSHRTTTTLQYISKVPYQNAYYANGSDTHGVVRIESDIDLKQYQADYVRDVVSVASGGTANAYEANVTAVAAGSFTITVQNITAGSLSEAPVINFAIIKGVTSGSVKG